MANFATIANVTALMGTPPADSGRVTDLLTMATAVIRAAAPTLPGTLPDPAPGAEDVYYPVRIVCAQMVADALTYKAGSEIASESIGQYSVSYKHGSSSSTSFRISDDHLALLRPWRRPRHGSAPIDLDRP